MDRRPKAAWRLWELGRSVDRSRALRTQKGRSSGCAALIYEIVWYQLLQLVIGSTAVSLGVLGLLASAATVVTLPVPVWTGTLADRFGAIPLVVAAQLLQAVGYVSFSWVKTPAGVFVASALVAVGVRVFWSAIFTAIADYADLRKGPAGTARCEHSCYTVLLRRYISTSGTPS